MTSDLVPTAALEGEVLAAPSKADQAYADPGVQRAIATVMHRRAGHGGTDVELCVCSNLAMPLAEAATAARLRTWGGAAVVTSHWCQCGHPFEGHGDDARLLCVTPYCRCPGFDLGEVRRTQTRTLIERYDVGEGS